MSNIVVKNWNVEDVIKSQVYQRFRARLVNRYEDEHPGLLMDYAVEVLHDLGVLRKVDAYLVSRFADVTMMLQESREDLNKFGAVDEGTHGTKVSPFFTVWERLETLSLKYMEQLGMTPASALRIKKMAKEEAGDVGSNKVQRLFEARAGRRQQLRVAKK